MIRLVLVEDHVSYGQALAGMADLEDDLEVVASLTRGDEAADVVETSDAHVLVVDLDLPGISGIEVIHAVRARRPATACVVLTALTDDVELGRAVEAGATAVLHKSVPVADVFAVARAVAGGANRLDPALTTRWLGALARSREEGWRARVTSSALSAREREVLQLLATGASSHVIAERLRIAEATVQTHVRNLRGKLGVGSRLEAVLEAQRLGLIDRP